MSDTLCNVDSWFKPIADSVSRNVIQRKLGTPTPRGFREQAKIAHI